MTECVCLCVGVFKWVSGCAVSADSSVSGFLMALKGPGL